jgi:hypothetical protein
MMMLKTKWRKQKKEKEPKPNIGGHDRPH